MRSTKTPPQTAASFTPVNLLRPQPYRRPEEPPASTIAPPKPDPPAPTPVPPVEKWVPSPHIGDALANARKQRKAGGRLDSLNKTFRQLQRPASFSTAYARPNAMEIDNNDVSTDEEPTSFATNPQKGLSTRKNSASDSDRGAYPIVPAPLPYAVPVKATANTSIQATDIDPQASHNNQAHVLPTPQNWAQNRASTQASAQVSSTNASARELDSSTTNGLPTIITTAKGYRIPGARHVSPLPNLRPKRPKLVTSYGDLGRGTPAAPYVKGKSKSKEAPRPPAYYPKPRALPPSKTPSPKQPVSQMPPLVPPDNFLYWDRQKAAVPLERTSGEWKLPTRE